MKHVQIFFTGILSLVLAFILLVIVPYILGTAARKLASAALRFSIDRDDVTDDVHFSRWFTGFITLIALITIYGMGLAASK